jgi:hypothetical protein
LRPSPRIATPSPKPQPSLVCRRSLLRPLPHPLPHPHPHPHPLSPVPLPVLLSLRPSPCIATPSPKPRPSWVCRRSRLLQVIFLLPLPTNREYLARSPPTRSRTSRFLRLFLLLLRLRLRLSRRSPPMTRFCSRMPISSSSSASSNSGLNFPSLSPSNMLVASLILLLCLPRPPAS